jgi:hypothetical protein
MMILGSPLTLSRWEGLRPLALGASLPQKLNMELHNALVARALRALLNIELLNQT